MANANQSALRRTVLYKCDVLSLLFECSVTAADRCRAILGGQAMDSKLYEKHLLCPALGGHFGTARFVCLSVCLSHGAAG